MIIDCLSDTHNQHKKVKLSGGDLLIHAGDFSSMGRPEEITSFLDWYAKQKYKNIILIAGNHDWGMQHQPEKYAKECSDRNITLLNDSGCTIEGVNIWGSPVQPFFCNWAFNRFRGDDISQHWDLIPENTEILVTHGPPHMILDGTVRGGEHVGCEDLYRKIVQTKVKLHIFGHIHEARGHMYLNGRTYVNASSLDERYYFRAPGYNRIIGKDNEYLVE